MSDRKTPLVISARAADFAWRTGGAAALHRSFCCEVAEACQPAGDVAAPAAIPRTARKLIEGFVFTGEE